METYMILYKLIIFSFLGFLYKKYIFKCKKNYNKCFSPELGIYTLLLLYFKESSIIEIIILCFGSTYIFKEILNLTGDSEIARVNTYSLTTINILNVLIINNILDYIYMTFYSFIFSIIILIVSILFFLNIAINQRKNEKI